jgi:hypothetical protein
MTRVAAIGFVVQVMNVLQGLPVVAGKVIKVPHEFGSNDGT